MSIKRKILLAAALGSMFTVSSCKKYLDVNKDPNVAQNVTPNLLLPTGEIYIASALGVDFEVNGSIWAEYWTQNPNSSQYRQLEQYQPTAASYETPWANLYNGAENMYKMNQLAAAGNQKQYMAISYLLRAYTFQLITDAWGDVPFSEALKGLPQDGGITSPHFDLQRAIYQGLLGYIDSANALIDPNDASAPGADDLIYGGDMTKWQKFSNTLRLKILLRMSEVDPGTAQAGIVALYATAPSFIDEGDDAQINFSSTSGNKNPLYAEEVGLGGTQNLVGSGTCIDSMNANDDYRAFIFYQYVPSQGVPVGIRQGDYDTVVSAGSFSLPTSYVAGDANDNASALAPVKFLTSYESLFLQAEAIARGWAAGDDADLYMRGIHASFFSYSGAFSDENLQLAAAADSMTSSNGNLITSDIFLDANYAYYSYMNGDTIYSAPASYWATYPTGGNTTEKLRFIITQKWYAMCGNQGFEAWTEFRRTGYPDFLVISKNSLLGNQFPKRFIYPTSEITRNVNFPGLKSVTTKVWWDVQ